MKTNNLFPNKYKKIGWLILIPSLIIGFYSLATEYEPSFLDLSMPSIHFDFSFLNNKSVFQFTETNIWFEIIGILIILSALLVAFSETKIEDEYMSKIRSESLIWAVYFNSIVLILSLLFVYGMSFIWVMVFNLFTIILFFIIRFNWQVSKLKTSTKDEE